MKESSMQIRVAGGLSPPTMQWRVIVQGYIRI